MAIEKAKNITYLWKVSSGLLAKQKIKKIQDVIEIFHNF